MSEARDVEAIVAGLESRFSSATFAPDIHALIADWRAKQAEIERLKISVIAFLAPHAVKYAKDHGLDGLHPTHYDLLEECVGRMVDFKRALKP